MTDQQTWRERVMGDPLYHDFSPNCGSREGLDETRNSGRARDPLGRLLPEDAQARFWSRVERGEGCWLWKGTVTRNGYGQFSIGYQHHAAHRLAYEWARGPIPEGLSLDHLCRNKVCVNPAHLEPVTTQENVLRGIGFAAVNSRKTRCPRGHEYTHADKTNRRHCRTCDRQHDSEYRARRRAA